MKFKEAVPYIYGITANINFVTSQVFFKMLTVVIPASTVLSFQAFFLLLFNTYIIVSHDKYRTSWEKYDTNRLSYSGSKFDKVSIQNEDRF